MAEGWVPVNELKKYIDNLLSWPFIASRLSGDVYRRAERSRGFGLGGGMEIAISALEGLLESGELRLRHDPVKGSVSEKLFGSTSDFCGTYGIRWDPPVKGARTPGGVRDKVS